MKEEDVAQLVKLAHKSVETAIAQNVPLYRTFFVRCKGNKFGLFVDHAGDEEFDKAELQQLFRERKVEAFVSVNRSVSWTCRKDDPRAKAVIATIKAGRVPDIDPSELQETIVFFGLDQAGNQVTMIANTKDGRLDQLTTMGAKLHYASPDLYDLLPAICETYHQSGAVH